MSLERVGSSASGILQTVKEKGAEAVRATNDLIFAAEQQLRGATLQDVVQRGKLVALDAMGVMSVSNAGPLYQHRVKGLVKTRRLLESIDEEFHRLVADAAALGQRFDKLCRLLNQFRWCCDSHIAISREDEESLAQRDKDNDFVDVASELNSASQVPPTSKEDARVLQFQDNMRRMIAELQETVELNCGGICKTAIRSLDQAHLEVVRQVTAAQTALDLQRRKVQNGNDGLKKLRDEVKKMPEAHAQKSLRVMQLEQMEASHSVKVEEEQQLRSEFDQTVRSGLSSLHYALEQSSMSTWSVYNIFFAQMNHFFVDAGNEASEVAKAFAALKNSQGVSKRISEEKRQMLEKHRQQATGVSFVYGDSSAGSPAVAPSAAGPALTWVMRDGSAEAADTDDFDTFVSQRQHSVVTAEPVSVSRGGTRARSDELWDDLFGTTASVPS